MIRIFVTDDHAVVRRGVIQILEEAPDMIVAGQSDKGVETLNALRHEHYDVLLLDIALPDLDGIEVLRQVVALHLPVRVLVLSTYSEDQFAIRALQAGAAGYLTKESAPEELIAAIRRVSQGGKYITPSLAEKLAERLGEKVGRPPHEKLSDREFQVFMMIANGKTVGEIATDLALSVKSISTYRTRILEKLDLKNNVEIARYALENKLI